MEYTLWMLVDSSIPIRLSFHREIPILEWNIPMPKSLKIPTNLAQELLPTIATYVKTILHISRAAFARATRILCLPIAGAWTPAMRGSRELQDANTANVRYLALLIQCAIHLAPIHFPCFSLLHLRHDQSSSGSRLLEGVPLPATL